MNRRSALVAVLAVLAPMAAWWLPGPKDAAVAGRLDYPQLLLAIATTLLGIAALVVIAAGRQRRSVLAHLALLGLGSAVGLGLAELLAWAWPVKHLMDNPWYQATGQAMQPAGDLPYLRPPHLTWTGVSRGDLAMDDDEPDPFARTVTFATDSEGFRNAAEAASADIVFLGDSFTEAGNTPIDETFPARVGAGVGRSVHNLGVAGFAPPTELIVLRRFGLKRSPRTVVWQIAESNDLADAVDYVEWLRNGRPDFRQDLRGLPTRRAAWARRSPTRRVFDLLRRPTPWPMRGLFRDAAGVLFDVRFEYGLPGNQQLPDEHPGWPAMVATLREGARILSARRVALVVVLIPMKLRGLAESIRFDPVPVDRHDGTRIELVTWSAADDLPPARTMASHLERLCREWGVRFVDTTPALKRGAAQGQVTFLPMDTHLAPAGHRIVAEEILKALPRVE